jgi:hypothetical protein
MSLALFMLGVMLFAFGVIAQQSNMIQRELWRLKQDRKLAAMAADRSATNPSSRVSAEPETR